ncbi:MAG: DNA polymerase III subunit beta [Acidiferrobacter sp.]
MQITLDSQTLRAGLATVKHAIDNNSLIPILSHVLLKTTGSDRLQIVGGNMEMELQTEVQASLEKPGFVALPVRPLIGLCQSVPNDISIAITVGKVRATIQAGHSRFTLPYLPGEDYPRIAPDQAKTTFTMAAGRLGNAIGLVRHAMAQHDTRYFLNGMLWELAQDHLVFVGADGHRLAMHTEPVLAASLASDAQIIVPFNGIRALASILTNVDEETVIHADISSSHLRLSQGPEWAMTTKLIDGRFPDYGRIMPRDQPIHITVDIAEMKTMLERVTLVTAQGSGIPAVRLNLDAETLQASVNTQESSAQDQMPVLGQGTITDMGLNARYLLDVLSILPGPTARIALTDHTLPFTVRPLDADDTICVVMPLK